MLVCKVVGTVVSSRKHEQLVGLKLLVIRPVTAKNNAKDLVAVDNIGAGIGEIVLVSVGSAARQAIDKPQAPVDAAVVGIVDAGNPG